MEELLRNLNLLKIGEFNFLKVLSGGKMAASAIYVTDNDQKVVIKFLVLPRNEIELKHFKNEAQILHHLSCSDYSKFLVKGLSDLVEVTPYPVYYFVMEYIEGNTLQKEFENEPLPWSVDKSVQYLFRITGSLSLCAISGVVHRDLHPGNIMVTTPYDSTKKYISDSDFDIRILDFGVYKDWLDIDWQESDFRHIGALSSWSPESLSSPSTVNPAHDIWGIGSIFFRMLTGEYAFYAKNFGDYYKLITTGMYNQQKLEELRIPEEIIFLVKRMFSVDPRNRITNGDLTKVCYDYLYNDLTNLLAKDKYLKEFYFRYDGDIWRCPHCQKIVYPDGQICTICGQMIDMFIPFYE